MKMFLVLWMILILVTVQGWCPNYVKRSIYNNTSGNQLGINSDGSININQVSGSTIAVTASYYVGKAPTASIGKTSVTGAITDTDFNTQYFAFVSIGGTATVDLTGAITDTINLFDDYSESIEFPIPTTSSITFNISSLQSGATVKWHITGVN